MAGTATTALANAPLLLLDEAAAAELMEPPDELAAAAGPEVVLRETQLSHVVRMTGYKG